MHVVALMPDQPRSNPRMLVCRVVVDDQMHIEIRGHCLVHMLEKRQEFLMPVARLTLGNDFTRCRIERREQSSGAMPDVIRRTPSR